ncbi:MAG: arginine--tRNA ligase [Actinomycetota bacterium]|nr:arginine--tRNA ligase [Actinomycetota bacterium]
MIRDVLAAALAATLDSLGVDRPSGAIHLERPARREHGDWSSNVAMASAKAAGRNPRELAQEIVAALSADPPPHVTSVEIAGPGFVNFHLAATWLHDVLSEVVDRGSDGYSRLDLAQGLTVNIEYVSANPTGPLHAGGGRWGAFGDTLARVFDRCGYGVHREYYINDRGVQTQLFGASLQAAKTGAAPPDQGYVGAYITEWANEMPDGADPVEFGRDRSLADVGSALAAMNVTFDRWASEKALVESGAMEAALKALRSAGYVEEHDGATWLRTTEFGDDQDRVLIKSDGEPTYFVPDIAYHHDKFNRGDLVIDILGADHHGYVGRMKAAMQMLGHPEDAYEVIIGQNVTLMRDGVEVKISKRAGTMIEVGDLVDEVGPDVARFAYLLQSIDTRQTIDLDVLSAQANENPVFYVQYAHARIQSIGREAANRGIERVALEAADLGLLAHERELEVLRLLSALPETLELALRERAPHKISTWVRELASAFHGFYHDCPILHPDTDDATRQARLWLVEGARIGFAIGLDLLGVSAPEEM